MKARKAWNQIQAILGTPVDNGVPGPTDDAALAKLRAAAKANQDWPPDAPINLPEGPLVDDWSEKVIRTLLPPLHEPARQLVRAAAQRGIRIKLTSGTRTYEEQNALYAQGRTAPGKIVTNARGGFSSHNFGTAFDITIFDDNGPVWESPNYKIVGSLGKAIGLTWGGDWSSPDEPHFYLKPEWAKNMSESAMMAELRHRHDTNKPVFS